MTKKKYLITTAIDYTNDVIHLGHAYQKVLADALARFFRLSGHKVYFVTGTDEHGGNVEKAAKKNNRTPKSWCDEISKKDREELDILKIGYDRFIRTTDADHEETSLWFYQKVLENGDIYQGEYSGFYCDACEAYKTVSELKDGRCEFHPNLELKRVIEKNYFFRWSRYADFLKEYIKENPRFIIPETRRREMLSFLGSGLEDIPVTRQNIEWGFKAPNDPRQTIYVWFDALINYYTAAKKTGFWDENTFIIHVLGKDNTRWHTLLWPAMLKSAGLRLPDTTLNHGFLTLEGKKISKTLGNIIRPSELVTKYGTDAVRYYLLRFGPLFDDADISVKRLEEVYNSDLANNLGNLTSRTAKLCENSAAEFALAKKPGKFHPAVIAPLKNFRVDMALAGLFETKIKETNEYIDRERPWTKSGDELNKILNRLVENIREIAFNLEPFLPDSAAKIREQFKGPKIKPDKPLFPRIS
ncbi:MAG: methionine--tRNA ligase [Patescibacteria group bacterium]|nr:methionine--tRNA ligase [Patescibacteria group bacterium]